jgi:capsular polysaccharide transport system permease protein
MAIRELIKGHDKTSKPGRNDSDIVQATTTDLIRANERLPTVQRLTGHLATFVGRKGPRGYSEIAASGNGGGLLIRSFFMVVVLPAFVTLLYSALWASDVYVVESKMTVREAINPESNSAALNSGTTSSLLGSLGLSGSTGTAQDALIILDYVKSRAVIGDVGAREVMDSYYNRVEIDFLSRLGKRDDMESLWSYWRDHVTASVDTQSNILTLKVQAFTPEDAYKLSQAILDKSEALINQISARNRQDAMKRANEEVERSISQLADIRMQVLKFQKANNSLDPVETAKQITGLLSSLSIKRIELESELDAAKLSGVSNRASDRFAKTQLEVLETQITNLKNLLTGSDQPNNVSQQLKEFEILKLRQNFAEQVYTLARTSFEDARRKLEKQQLYVVVVVPPLLPQEALYPRPFVNTALVFFACFIIWAIVALVAAGIKDST